MHDINRLKRYRGIVRSLLVQQQGSEVIQAIIMVAIAALILLGVKGLARQLHGGAGGSVAQLFGDGRSVGVDNDAPPDWDRESGGSSNPESETDPDDEPTSENDQQPKRYKITGKGFTEEQKRVAEKIMDQFMAAGYSKEEAAAFVGNAYGESELIADRNQNKGPAYGLFQWEGPRRKQLMQYAKSNKLDYRDEDTQIQFALHELQTTEARANRKVKAASGLDAKTKAVRIWYERPNPAKAHDETRIRGAQMAIQGDVA